MRKVLIEAFDDVLLVGGFAFVEYGLWLVYQPAALVVGGTLGLAAWLRRNFRARP